MYDKYAQHNEAKAKAGGKVELLPKKQQPQQRHQHDADAAPDAVRYAHDGKARR